MDHSPIAFVCAVAVTAGLVDASSVEAGSRGNHIIVSAPTWVSPRTAVVPTAGGQRDGALHQLVWTTSTTSARSGGCEATPSSPQSGGAFCRENPLWTKHESAVWVRGGASDGGGANGGGADPSGKKAVKPGSPSKVAAEKSGPARGGGGGGGVWGSVARAWRAVRGGRPHNNGSNNRATSAVADPKASSGGGSHNSKVGGGAATSRDAGEETGSSGASPSGSGSGATRSGKASSSRRTTRNSSKKHSFPGEGTGGERQQQRAPYSTSIRRNVYGAAAAASPHWQPQPQRTPGSFVVSSAERERREVEVRDALVRAEGELGEEHPRVATLLFLLSRIVQERGDYTEAEVCLSKGKRWRMCNRTRSSSHSRQEMRFFRPCKGVVSSLRCLETTFVTVPNVSLSRAILSLSSL